MNKSPTAPHAPAESEAHSESSGGLRRVTLTAAVGTAPRDDDDISSPTLGTGTPEAEAAAAAHSDAARDAYLGALIDGRYVVEKVLGEGGMGIVYRCRHTIIDKLVAMKVLRADMARNEEVTERFLNEARSASSIGNPHIIDISDFGRLPDGATYFIMEYLDGTPLSDVVSGHEPLPVQRIAKIGQQMAEGLAAAHEAGIIHRDLKPDNVFLLRRGNQTDFVKILDFGIAKASSTSSKLTQAGQVFGTPHYMSPEQAAGTVVDHRSDIYAVGVILYELASGRLPFDAENFMAVLTQHMYKSPTPFAELDGMSTTVPPELEAIVFKCLSKRPDDRYASMSDLALDLGRLQRGVEPDALQEMAGRSERGSLAGGFLAEARTGSHRAPRSRAVTTLLGALTVVGLGVGAFLMTRPAPKQPVVPLAPANIASTPAPSIPAPPETTRVALAVSPLDAHVFQGERDWGQSPVVIDVGSEPVSLEIRRDGYETRTVVVNGDEPKLSITLRPLKPAATKPAAAKPASSTKPAATPQAPPKKKGSLAGGEIVNPWD